MTHLASHPISPVYVRVYIRRLATYVKLTPKQKAAMLAILHVPSATLANWPCRQQL